MKMNMYLKWLKGMALTALFCLALSGLAFGQAENPNAPIDEAQIPIDGGVSWLAAAGVAYGVKKYRDYKKNSPGPDQEED